MLCELTLEAIHFKHDNTVFRQRARKRAAATAYLRFIIDAFRAIPRRARATVELMKLIQHPGGDSLAKS